LTGDKKYKKFQKIKESKMIIYQISSFFFYLFIKLSLTNEETLDESNYLSCFLCFTSASLVLFSSLNESFLIHKEKKFGENGRQEAR